MPAKRLRLLAASLGVLLLATSLPTLLLATDRNQSQSLPVGLTGDNATSCMKILAVESDNVPERKRDPFWKALEWWRIAGNQLPRPQHDPQESDVSARFNSGELKKASDACFATMRGKSLTELAAATAKLVDGLPVLQPPAPAAPPPPPPEPPMLSMDQMFPPRPKAAEDMLDCQIASAHTMNYTSGKPDHQKWMDFYLMISKAASLPKLDTNEFRSRAITTNKILNEAEITDIAQRCWANFQGQPNVVNPYREKLLGADRYRAFVAGQAEFQRAAEAQQQVRQAAEAQARAEASARDAELAVQRQRFERCDAAAAAGIEGAQRKLREAQRETLSWAATGGYGSNGAMNAFEGGCRSLASTWKTMQNMDCPMEVAGHVKTLIERDYYLDTGGAVNYCRAEWQ